MDLRQSCFFPSLDCVVAWEVWPWLSLDVEDPTHKEVGSFGSVSNIDVSNVSVVDVMFGPASGVVARLSMEGRHAGEEEVC